MTSHHHPQHQQAVRQCLDRLWADPAILAVALFGSVKDGVARPDSDVDLFVIEDAGDARVWKGVYLRQGGLVFHLQYLSKVQLGEACTGLRGGPFHRAFASATLLAVRDAEVEALFAGSADFPAADRELRTLGAAAGLCDALYRLQKLAAGPVGAADTAGAGGFQTQPSLWLRTALRVLDDLAQITLISRGRPPGPEPLAEATELDPELGAAARSLTDEATPQAARRIHALGEGRLSANLEAWTRPLLRVLEERGGSLALDELAEQEVFAPLKADFEKLIFRLARVGLLDEEERPFQPTASDQPVGREIAYSVPTTTSGGRACREGPPNLSQE